MESIVLELYHVTETKNVANILEVGLEPRIGPRSKLLQEKEKAVYLFKTKEDAEDGIINWFGDLFNKNEPLSLLMITLISTMENRLKEIGFEYQCSALIPKEYITDTQTQL